MQPLALGWRDKRVWNKTN